MFKLDTPTENDIREKFPKPSDAIQGMVDGLLTMENNPHFEINMTSFGEWAMEDGVRIKPEQICPTDRICFGCAATATVYGAFHLDPQKVDPRDVYDVLEEFEKAIDILRLGITNRLLNWYNVPTNLIHKVNVQRLTLNLHWEMDTDTWKEHIPTLLRFKTILLELEL